MKLLLLVAAVLACSSCFSQVIPVKSEWKTGQIFHVTKDTVEITGNIRFIKVDGKVYEIKRTTSIEEAKPFSPFGSGNLWQGCDTVGMPTLRFFNNTVPAGNLPTIIPGL